MKPEELGELMQTLDDAWNAGPSSPLWETFKKRHTRTWLSTGLASPSLHGEGTTTTRRR